jgi:hypothetical protein
MWDYDEERENALYNESLTQGQFMDASMDEYVRNYGEMNPDVAWISTPFDTWGQNPFYTGPAVPHPEMVED